MTGGQNFYTLSGMKHLYFFLLLCLTSLHAAATGGGYYMADLRARQATLKDAESIETLAAYLTKDLKTDVQKVRAVAVWMVYQMEKNGYRAKQLIRYSNLGIPAPAPLENDPFKTRIGTPREFAALFEQIARAAGLNVVTVNGYAGKNISAPRARKPAWAAAQTLLSFISEENSDLQRYEAAWNAVEIDKEWYLIDTYWMIAGTTESAKDISSDAGMRLFLKRRLRHTPAPSTLRRGKTIDEDYFFAKPRFFIKTHFPLDPKWQFITPPRSWATFVS